MDRGDNKVLHTVVCKVALSVQASSRLRTPQIAEPINSETVPRSLHRTALATLVVRKFMRPFLTNIASNITEDLQEKEVIKEKPTSRKVLKV